MEALELYEKVSNVPEWAKKPISAGRLKGLTDINPQWRIFTLVENFGFCGIGWIYSIKRVWTEKADSEILAFAEIELKIKAGDTWSEPIPGIGGSKMVAKENSGLHSSDECYKMAVTDAISVACKMLGVGASVYSGSKYCQYIEFENKEKEQKDLFEEAKKSVLNCNTIFELEEVYKKYPTLSKNNEFINICANRKKNLQ
jgi:hypothetical protein